MLYAIHQNKTAVKWVECSLSHNVFENYVSISQFVNELGVFSQKPKASKWAQKLFVNQMVFSTLIWHFHHPFLYVILKNAHKNRLVELIPLNTEQKTKQNKKANQPLNFFPFHSLVIWRKGLSHSSTETTWNVTKRLLTSTTMLPKGEPLLLRCFPDSKRTAGPPKTTSQPCSCPALLWCSFLPPSTILDTASRSHRVPERRETLLYWSHSVLSLEGRWFWWLV